MLHIMYTLQETGDGLDDGQHCVIVKEVEVYGTGLKGITKNCSIVAQL